MVPQQVYIFDDTIRRNLDLKGTCTDEELLAIISKVKLDRFFAANGYTLDTQISNETLQVSGGEKDRPELFPGVKLFSPNPLDNYKEDIL